MVVNMNLPSPHLASLLTRLTDWIPISEFEARMRDYFEGDRPQAEIADFRAKRSAVKSLRCPLCEWLLSLRSKQPNKQVRSLT